MLVATGIFAQIVAEHYACLLHIGRHSDEVLTSQRSRLYLGGRLGYDIHRKAAPFGGCNHKRILRSVVGHHFIVVDATDGLACIVVVERETTIAGIGELSLHLQCHILCLVYIPRIFPIIAVSVGILTQHFVATCHGFAPSTFCQLLIIYIRAIIIV